MQGLYAAHVMTTNGYTVEGWSGLDCTGFRSVARAATALREAQHQVLDLGADRVYIRRAGVVVAEMNETTHMHRVTDPALVALMEGAI